MLSLRPWTIARISGLLVALLPVVMGSARAAEPAPAPSPAAPAVTEQAPDTDTRVAVSAALGERLYKLGRYDEAVAEYRRAYELRADPRFLYHIARCYRELGAGEQALFYYERYLAVAPTAPEREEVLDRIAEIEALRARPSRPARTRPILVPDEPKKPAGARPWRRWWFWTALGLAVTTGVTAALVSGRAEIPSPATALGDKRFY